MYKAILQGMFWGSYLVFPAIFVLSFLIVKYWGKKVRKWLFVLMVLALLFVEARFLEPNLIWIAEYKVDFWDEEESEVKIAMVSDLHLGVFKGEDYLKRIVEKVNQVDPDLVFLPGDFVYYAENQNLGTLFEPLKDLEAPGYAVFGNHDYERNELNSEMLLKVLENLDVETINNEWRKMEVNGQSFILLGVDSWMERKADLNILNNLEDEEKIILLTHNPDVVDQIPEKLVDLTISGHTHCGQIRLPFIYKFVIPTKGDFDKGWTQEKNSKLFISCGLGENLLPMRFLNPPQIDVVTLF